MNNEEADVIVAALMLQDDPSKSILFDMPVQNKSQVDMKVIAAIAVLDSHGQADFSDLVQGRRK